MRIKLWGVRGSYPSPGPDTVVYGGNTPCLEVQAGDSRIIVDAGTGIYKLGQKLAQHPGDHHLLFSHIHWDHIQGLPTFTPLFQHAARITIYAPPRFLGLIRELLTDGTRQIYLPVHPSHLNAQLSFVPFDIGESFSIGEIQIGTVRLNHPFICVGFSFEARGRKFVFFSDTAPFSNILFGYEFRPHPPHPDEKPDQYETKRLNEMRKAAVNLTHRADVLIYDAHFTPEEYPLFAHFGHSTPEHAIEIARDAHVKQLLLFHHAPSRSDKAITQIEERFRPVAAQYGIDLRAAREGDRIEI